MVRVSIGVHGGVVICVWAISLNILLCHIVDSRHCNLMLEGVVVAGRWQELDMVSALAPCLFPL